MVAQFGIYISQNLLRNNWEICYVNIYHNNADAFKLEPNLIELLIQNKIFYQEVPLFKN